MLPKELVETIRQCMPARSQFPRDRSPFAEHYSDEALTGREIEVLHQLAGGNRNET